MGETIRVEHSKDYTVISNVAIRDTRLSFKSRGLHHLLLSYPDGWQINTEHLSEQSDKDGKDAIASALKELESVGYLIRTQIRVKGKIVGYKSTIRELPLEDPPQPKGRRSKKKPQPEKPDTAKPDRENPDTAKPDRENPELENPVHINYLFNEVINQEISREEVSIPPNPQNENKRERREEPPTHEVEVLPSKPINPETPKSALEQTRFPGNQNSESLLPTENLSLGQNSPPLASDEAQLIEGFQSLTGKNPQTGKDYFPWEGLTMQQGRQKVTSDPDFVSYVAKSLASKYSMYKELNLVELRRETSKFIHKAGTDFNREREVQNYWDDYLSGISTTATIRDVERASKPRIYFGVRL